VAATRCCASLKLPPLQLHLTKDDPVSAGAESSRPPTGKDPILVGVFVESQDLVAAVIAKAASPGILQGTWDWTCAPRQGHHWAAEKFPTSRRPCRRCSKTDCQRLVLEETTGEGTYPPRWSAGMCADQNLKIKSWADFAPFCPSGGR